MPFKNNNQANAPSNGSSNVSSNVSSNGTASLLSNYEANFPSLNPLKFSGEPHEDVMLFIQDIETKHPSDDVARLKLCLSNCTSKAARSLNSSTPAIRSNWDELRNHLLTTFSNNDARSEKSDSPSLHPSQLSAQKIAQAERNRVTGVLSTLEQEYRPLERYIADVRAVQRSLLDEYEPELVRYFVSGLDSGMVRKEMCDFLQWMPGLPREEKTLDAIILKVANAREAYKNARHGRRPAHLKCFPLQGNLSGLDYVDRFRDVDWKAKGYDEISCVWGFLFGLRDKLDRMKLVTRFAICGERDQSLDSVFAAVRTMLVERRERKTALKRTRYN